MKKILVSVENASAHLRRSRRVIERAILDSGVEPAGKQRGHPLYGLAEVIAAVERRNKLVGYNPGIGAADDGDGHCEAADKIETEWSAVAALLDKLENESDLAKRTDLVVDEGHGIIRYAEALHAAADSIADPYDRDLQSLVADFLVAGTCYEVDALLKGEKPHVERPTPASGA
jgi:hypothetical protein